MSIRDDAPLKTKSSPGWQFVCWMQVMHSLLEQWNPCLHKQVLFSFLLTGTGVWKFLSERRRFHMSDEQHLIKNNSVQTVWGSYWGHSTAAVYTSHHCCNGPDIHWAHSPHTQDHHSCRMMSSFSLKRKWFTLVFQSLRRASSKSVGGSEFWKPILYCAEEPLPHIPPALHLHLLLLYDWSTACILETTKLGVGDRVSDCLSLCTVYIYVSLSWTWDMSWVSPASHTHWLLEVNTNSLCPGEEKWLNKLMNGWTDN